MMESRKTRLPYPTRHVCLFVCTLSTHGLDSILVRQTRDPWVENVQYIAEERTTLWFDGSLDLGTIDFVKPDVEYTMAVRDMPPFPDSGVSMFCRNQVQILFSGEVQYAKEMSG